MMSLYEMLPALKPWEARLWTYVLVDDGCWTWTGHHHHREGYALFSVATTDDVEKRTEIPVHRYIYEILNSKVPDGLELDHLCRNAGCVNPDHLEPVTHKENLGRAGGLCKRGHPLEGNRKRYPSGRSECLTCWTDRIANSRWQRAVRGRKKGRPRTSASTDASERRSDAT